MRRPFLLFSLRALRDLCALGGEELLTAEIAKACAQDAERSTLKRRGCEGLREGAERSVWFGSICPLNVLLGRRIPPSQSLDWRYSLGGKPHTMLHSKDVPISQSALLVIDAQESFKLDAKKWERRNNRDFEKNVTRLIEAYREAKLPVIFFIHTDEDPGFGTDHPLFKLMEFIKPRADEPLIQKNTRNAFTSTGLSAMLLEKDVRRVAITGIKMEQCCETTA